MSNDFVYPWRAQLFKMTILLFLSLLCLDLTTGAAMAIQRCTISDIVQCKDISEVLSTKEFKDSLARFVGSYKGQYISAHDSLVEQILSVLGGSPRPATQIGNIRYFVSCMAHNCGEKGIVVFGKDGTLKAIALLHSDCALAQHNPNCYRELKLTILTRSLISDRVHSIIIDLARKEINQDNRDDTALQEEITHIEDVNMMLQ